MSETAAQTETAAHTLRGNTSRARETLRAVLQRGQKERFDRDVMPFLLKCSDEGQHRAVVPLELLALKPEEVQGDVLPPTWKQILDAEGLRYTVGWRHNCSYCEECGTGCRPATVVISWNDLKN